MSHKLVVIFVLAAFVILGIAAGKPPASLYENLKILPKDISSADLDSVMNNYAKALNVGCDFCHAKSKSNATEIDFASDDKPEKEITRQMMKMTEVINKDFFSYTIIYKANELMAVSCNTCHKGNPRPESSKE